jgi:hypothetical protein
VALTLIRTESGGLEIRAVPAGEVQPLAMTSRRSATIGLAANAVIGTLTMSSPAHDDDAALAAPMAEAAPLPALVAVAESGPFVVSLIRYRPEAQVDILQGENAGRVANYANIVTSWIPIANWDMHSPLQMTVPLAGDEPVVVIVQEVGLGEVLAVARMR